MASEIGLVGVAVSFGLDDDARHALLQAITVWQQPHQSFTQERDSDLASRASVKRLWQARPGVSGPGGH
jgi:hypothetical protein